MVHITIFPKYLFVDFNHPFFLRKEVHYAAVVHLLIFEYDKCSLIN